MGGRSPRVWLAIFCCAGLIACGGGGGGGGGSASGRPAGAVTGNGLAPSTGPGDTASYFPSAAGDQWSFNYNGPPNVLDAEELVVINDRTRKACIQGAEVVNGPCT